MMFGELHLIPGQQARNPSSSYQYAYGANGNSATLDIREGGSSSYFLFDALGSVQAATNASGAVVDTFHYDPYGTLTTTTGSLYEPIRYAGGYYATSSKLLKYGQRYYDPTLGRWTQPDPINQPLDTHGWNHYTYTGDDPINYTDSGGGAYGDPTGSPVSTDQLCGTYPGLNVLGPAGQRVCPEGGKSNFGPIGGCVRGVAYVPSLFSAAAREGITRVVEHEGAEIAARSLLRLSLVADAAECALGAAGQG